MNAVMGVVIFLWTLILSSPASATVDVNTPFPLALRTGVSACWMKAPIENGSICIPENLWTKDFTVAGRWDGHWSITSPPENDEAPKRITRTFHASRKLLIEKNPDHSPWQTISTFIERRREETSQVINDQFSDPYGILKRLLLNESGPNDFSAFFRLVGFVHLFSASGIHLYALSTWVGWCVSLIAIWLLVPISIALPLARLLSVALWLWGWALSGCKLSLVRPLLLISIRKSASVLGFRWKVWTPLILSLCLDLGFSAFVSKTDWLSGAAFYGLAIAGGMLSKGPILISLSSWILLALWESLRLAHVALLTPILSLLTLTVTTLLIYPVLMMASFSGGSPFTHEISEVFGSFVKLLLSFSMNTGNLWIVRPKEVMASIFIVATSSLLKKPARYFLLGVSAIFLAALRLLPEPAQIVQIDVGQGDAAFYRDGTTSGMIDSGSKHSLSDVAWIEFFAHQGVTHLSWTGLTHLDEDHSGGTLRLARLLPIDCVATSDNELISPRGVIYENSLKEMRIEVDHSLSACVPFPSYEPPEQAPSAHGTHIANENMSAFIIPLKGDGFWLSAGDATEKDELTIGQWAEKEIAKLSPRKGASRILKVSHHGSKTSSNPDFIEMIKPTQAWISDGVGNRYGHPAPSVLEELGRFGIPVRRTDESGELREEDDHRRQ